MFVRNKLYSKLHFNLDLYEIGLIFSQILFYYLNLSSEMVKKLIHKTLTI